jgi:hypothetical protein
MKPRILLAGIAKDEAAYLPEWIAHHLALGIDSVLVYVNNTTDNTIQLLEKLKKKLPVNYKVVDGIDTLEDEYFDRHISNRLINYSPLQSKSYADIYRCTSSADYDFILYLDIDEFLCLEMPISESFLYDTFVNDVTLFQWFSATGDEVPFSILSCDIKGEFDQFCKFMVKTGKENIVFESHHHAKVDNVPPSVDRTGLIVHRVLRSQQEYLALLARSNPDKKNLSNGFKLNRRGWTSKATNKLPNSFKHNFKNHSDNFSNFCHSNDIESEIFFARQSVLIRANAVIEKVLDLNKQNSELGRVLDGTGLKHVSIYSWLKNELKNKFILTLFPSLKIKHIPFINYFTYKIGMSKRNDHLRK